MSDLVLVERFDKVARLTLNRPDRMNAINEPLREALEEHFRAFAEDDGVSVIILRGSGRGFCSGYDLQALPGSEAGSSPTYGEVPEIMRDRARLRRTVERWMWLWSYPKPTIAEVHGFCLSGGGEMASMFDLTICSEDAVFGHPAARANGIPPTLSLWPLKIGLARTKELLFTGDTISGREAAEWGIVNRCVPREELSDHVLALAQRIANVPLEALTIHKHVANRWYELMGVRTMVDEGADFDAIFHQLSVVKAFSDLAREKGVKAALEARDAPFRTAR